MTTEQEIPANKELREVVEIAVEKIDTLPVSNERDVARAKLSQALQWLDLDTKRLNAATPVKV